MKKILLITLLFLTSCGKYKCKEYDTKISVIPIYHKVGNIIVPNYIQARKCKTWEKIDE